MSGQQVSLVTRRKDLAIILMTYTHLGTFVFIVDISEMIHTIYFEIKELDLSWVNPDEKAHL